MPVVLHGCETWLFTLREEHRLKEAKNRVPRRIFGLKGDEVTGEWRTPHAYNRELNDLYSSQNIIWVLKSRRLRWAGNVARMGERRIAYRVLVGKLEGDSPLGRSGVDCRIILRWVFRKWAVRESTGSIWFRVGTGGGHL